MTVHAKSNLTGRINDRKLLTLARTNKTPQLQATRMLVLMTVFCLFLSPTMACKAPEIIDVRIHQAVLLQGSLWHPQYGTLVGWFSCPTRDCNNEWDKHWIADIRFMENVIIENPHYEAFLNGTLLIKKVLPMYDGRYFIMRVRTASGDEPNIYHLKVVQERPVLTLVNPQNIYVFEGMDVFFDAQVKAYPYARVSLSHVLESNESVIQEMSNVSSQILIKIPSITEASSGDYVLRAVNTVGSNNVSVRVSVEDIPGRSSSPIPDECSNDVNFTTAFRNPSVRALVIILALIIILAVIGIVIVLRSVLCKACNCHLNQGKQYDLEVNDKECDTTANNGNKSIAKEEMDSAEKVYHPFDVAGAFDRNRGAIALDGKYR